MKGCGGPMQGGYSTEFMKNTYFLAKMRAAMKNKLRVLTSSKHKETAFFGKYLHYLN